MTHFERSVQVGPIIVAVFPGNGRWRNAAVRVGYFNLHFNVRHSREFGYSFAVYGERWVE